MQHSQIVQDHLIEQYLLNEMTAPARDEFEDHFFDCRDCGAELKATAAFLDATREELRQAHLQRINAAYKPKSGMRAWWSHLWTPAFGLSVAAACLLVVAYQNLVVFPKLHNEIATLESPEVLPTLSLIGAASRGGATYSVTVSKSRAIMLQLDIPTEPRFTSYTCRIYSPSQQLLGSVEISAQQAKDTVSIRASLPEGQYGRYSLAIQGHEASPDTSLGIDLEQIKFQINADTSGSEHPL